MEPDVDIFLTHHGIKGMHWGVRKEISSNSRIVKFSSVSSIQIEPDIHSSTKEAAKKVSELMAVRYGYKITSVESIKPGNPQYPTAAAYVENNSVSNGRSEGKIFVQSRDLSKILKVGEKSNWVAAGTGNVTAMLTHEAFHGAFHSKESLSRTSNEKQVVVGGNRKERNKALKAAIDQAYKDGVSIWSTSGYAAASGVRQELEAELFTQYNWADKPEAFVVAYGKTLNAALGSDPTPFKEVKLN